MKITNCAFINLDHRLDRLQFMHHQLQPYYSVISFKRFPGVNAINFLEYPVHDYIEPGSPIHKGVIGCWLAHQNIIEYYLNIVNEIDNEWLLILEDDIFIQPEFWNYIGTLEPPADSDMVFFDCAKTDVKPEAIIDIEKNLSRIYTSWPVFGGTHCYAINYRSLNKIYNILKGVTIFKDIDGYYFMNPNIIQYNYQTKLIKINYNFKSDRLNLFQE